VSGMWLTHLAVNSVAGDLTYDLSVDVSGRPARVAAGLLEALPFLALCLLGAGAMTSRQRTAR
jgi:hypothetical protein